MDPRWVGALALAAPLVGIPLGACMAVQWELTGPGTFEGGPPGAATIGPWLADRLPLLNEDGEPRWVFRGPFFVSLALIVPVAWHTTRRLGMRRLGQVIMGSLAVATAAVATEYSLDGIGWGVDLLALLVLIVAVTTAGIRALRHGRLPRPEAWVLALLPVWTFAGGFLVFWYMPPGLVVGPLLAFAFVGGGLLARHRLTVSASTVGDPAEATPRS